MKKFCSCLLFLLLLLLLQSCKKSTPKPLCGGTVHFGLDYENVLTHQVIADTNSLGGISSYIQGINPTLRVFSYSVSLNNVCPRDSVDVVIHFDRLHSADFVRSRAKVEWGNNNSLIVPLTPNSDSTQYSSGVVKIDISSSYNNSPGSVKVTLELSFPTEGNFQDDQSELIYVIGFMGIDVEFASFN